MIYMGSKYTARTQKMLSAQMPNAATNYPFAIVGINTTLLLATIISLKDQKYLSAQACYWKFFEHPYAFFEVLLQHILMTSYITCDLVVCRLLLPS